MMDPYVDEASDLLLNKFGIRNAEELIEVETQLFIANVLALPSELPQINVRTYESLLVIHRFLFQELYSWAGCVRTVNIYKSEQVLGGLSVTYADKDKLIEELSEIFEWANGLDWHQKEARLAENFAAFMTKLWRVHPFREGNTRTITVFMAVFAAVNKLPFNGELLSGHPVYLRNALVLSAVEEAPEPEYLLKMIGDALGRGETRCQNPF